MAVGMGRALAGALAGLAIGAAAAAGAGTPAEALAEAEARLAAGQGVEAVAAAYRALDSVWARAPIGFTAALLVAAPAEGYGLYEPRADAVFRPGEPIHVYAEPVAFAHGREGGRYEVAFDVDLAIFDAAGRRIAEIPGIEELRLVSRAPNREFPASITYEWAGAGPGVYRLVTTLRDRHSGKSGSFELTVEIVP